MFRISKLFWKTGTYNNRHKRRLFVGCLRWNNVLVKIKQGIPLKISEISGRTRSIHKDVNLNVMKSINYTNLVPSRRFMTFTSILITQLAVLLRNVFQYFIQGVVVEKDVIYDSASVY